MLAAFRDVPIAEVNEALRSLHPSWYVELGDPAGSGWIRGLALTTPDEEPMRGLLDHIGQRLKTSNKKIVAASFVLRFGWSASAAIGPFLVGRCVPDLALGRTSYKFSPATFFERTALHQSTAVTTHDSGALLTRLRDELFAQSEPVVEELYRWSRFPRRALWGQLMSSWGAPFVQVLERLGKPLDALPRLEAFFDDPRPAFRMRPRYYPVTVGPLTQVHHCRASCCLYYRIPPGEYCSSCPLIADDERLARNADWVRRVLATRVDAGRSSGG